MHTFLSCIGIIGLTMSIERKVDSITRSALLNLDICSLNFASITSIVSKYESYLWNENKIYIVIIV